MLKEALGVEEKCRKTLLEDLAYFARMNFDNNIINLSFILVSFL